MEAAELETRKDAKEQGQAADSSRVQECADFEQKFEIRPGTDMDAETDAVLQKADEEAELRHRLDESLPLPPPGVCPGPARYHLFRAEACEACAGNLTT